jgi:excisionase family DNA binding protein
VSAVSPLPGRRVEHVFADALTALVEQAVARSQASPSATEVRLLTDSQVAEQLGIGLTQAKQLRTSGALRTVRVGERGVRVRSDDLAAYIDEHTSIPVGAARPVLPATRGGGARQGSVA